MQSIKSATLIYGSDGAEDRTDQFLEQTQAKGLQLTDIDRLLPDTMKQAVGVGLSVAMTNYLGYTKHSEQGGEWVNSRNWSTSKSVHVTVGPVEFDVPKYPSGTFDPITVPNGTSAHFKMSGGNK